MNAFLEIKEYLDDDESIESIAFGPWGYCFENDQTDFEKLEDFRRSLKNDNRVLKEQKVNPVLIGVNVTIPSDIDQSGISDAFKGWSFDNDYGSFECHPVYVWTNKRVIFVKEYDGSTTLESVPRNPIDCFPVMK